MSRERTRLLREGPLDGLKVLSFLSDASKLLASSLDVELTLQHAAELAVPALGDWCTTDVVDPDGTLRRLAIVHADAERVRAGWDLYREFPPPPDGPVGPAHVVRTGVSQSGTVDREMWWRVARSPRHLQLLEETGIRAFVTAPLRARGRILGAITVASGGEDGGYSAEAVALVEELAGRIAVALDNALLYGASQRAEEAARRERARLEAVLQSLPVAVVIGEAPGGRLVLGNRMVEEILGRPMPHSPSVEAYGEWRVYHPDGRPLLPEENPIARAMRHGEIVRNEEYELERADGSRRAISTSAAPIRGPHGELTGGISVFNDITERLRARRKVEALATQLANQQRWLESLLDLSPIPLVLVEPASGEVTFANRAADALAGGRFPRERPDLRPELIREMSYPDGTPVEPSDTPMSRAVRGEKLEAFAVAWELPGGKRSLQVSSERLPAMFGHPETIVISYHDVTELRQTQEDLQRSLRTRDDFLSVAAHELRTPITSLRLYTQALIRTAAREALDPAALAERARNADRQVARLARLVESLLDLSRIQSGKLQLHPERVDLAQVVGDVLAQMDEEARRAGCTVTLSAGGPVEGEWDRLRVEQVVANLLSNALKYGAHCPVDVRVEARGEGALIEVRDRGIGISPEDQARLFQRFERAVSDRHYGGFGLGLWIVRQIVTAMGGEVSLESEEGRGSVFRVWLPGARNAATPDDLGGPPGSRRNGG